MTVMSLIRILNGRDAAVVCERTGQVRLTKRFCEDIYLTNTEKRVEF